MASSHDSVSMAVFCDFENVALGVRDAKYEKFDIKPVLERLLLKGSIVVKKAYCDWERYKGFKAVMHEANFELIEIPHVRQSGKNSADIRLVVDALDLCYTKSHVDTFVIISGDSDFSPLVSKLRENAKQVIGVGVKQSTSDLLIANCDEFIFYDDLVRESQRAAKRESREAQAAPKRSPEEEKRRRDENEARKTKAINIAVETFDALVSERGDSDVRIWASMLKEAIKRRKPDFNESYYGFRAFGNLLEEAQARGLLQFGRDEKSGAYVYRSNKNGGEQLSEHVPAATAEPADASEHPAEAAVPTPEAPRMTEEAGGRHESRRKGRGGRKHGVKPAEAMLQETHAPDVIAADTTIPQPAESLIPAQAVAPVAETATMEPHQPPKPEGRRTRRGRAKAAEAETPASPEAVPVSPEAVAVEALPSAPVVAAGQPEPVDETATKPARKSAPRGRRPRKAESQAT